MQQVNLTSLSHLLESQTNFKQRQNQIQRYKFDILYKKSPEQTLDMYTKRITKNLINSDFGYTCWIPITDNNNYYCISVGGFTECLPTQEELEAYKIVYGKDMEIPEHPSDQRHHIF